MIKKEEKESIEEGAKIMITACREFLNILFCTEISYFLFTFERSVKVFHLLFVSKSLKLKRF